MSETTVDWSDTLITWAEAAWVLGIRGSERWQRRQVLTLVRKKRLAGRKIGAEWKITVSSVEKLIEGKA